MAAHRSQKFLARQPIVDRSLNLFAYELLFRSGNMPEVVIDDDTKASNQVIQIAFAQNEISTIVGDYKAFINVDAQTLLSRSIESLPQDQVVIELLETIEVDDHILHRCRHLKQKGYRLALDDFVRYQESYEPLLEIVDIVKVDVLQLDIQTLARLVKRLLSWPPKLLAEKVETPQGARTCFDMGFTLFQGFLFGRPATMCV